MCWMETSALPWTTTPSRGTCVDAARRDRWMDGWIDDVSARRSDPDPDPDPAREGGKIERSSKSRKIFDRRPPSRRVVASDG